MKKHTRLVWVVGLLALGAGPAGAATCDRACLTGLLTKYVDAVVAHDASKLPTATGKVRFTEDSKELALGEGLWKTNTGKGGFRQDYIDLRKQIAATHVEMTEANAKVLYSVILHTADQKITGVETLVQRIPPDGRFQPDGSLAKMPGLKTAVPAGKKMSRAEMVKTALTYTEGLRIGNFTEGKTPFAKEAYRVENGMFIAGEGCPRAECPGLYTQKVMLHPDVKASVAAVDEEEGLVLLWMNFGDTNSYGPGNALITFEGFKVWGGQIHVVNAFFRTQPKDTQRGWPSAE